MCLRKSPQRGDRGRKKPAVNVLSTSGHLPLNLGLTTFTRTKKSRTGPGRPLVLLLGILRPNPNHTLSINLDINRGLHRPRSEMAEQYG